MEDGLTILGLITVFGLWAVANYIATPIEVFMAGQLPSVLLLFMNHCLYMIFTATVLQYESGYKYIYMARGIGIFGMLLMTIYKLKDS